MRARKSGGMSIKTVILFNGILDLGVVLAVAATMCIPFTIDRSKDERAVYALGTPLPDDLAA